MCVYCTVCYAVCGVRCGACCGACCVSITYRRVLIHFPVSFFLASFLSFFLRYDVFQFDGSNQIRGQAALLEQTRPFVDKVLGKTIAADISPLYALLDAWPDTLATQASAALKEVSGGVRDGACALVQGLLLTTVRFYSGPNGGDSILNPGYGPPNVPVTPAEKDAVRLMALKRAGFVGVDTLGHAVSAQKRLVKLLNAALVSPLLEKPKAPVTLWHGCLEQVADYFVASKKEKGKDVQFPGFMSTTKEFDAHIGWAIMKGHVLQLQRAKDEPDLGADVGDISLAPGEKEILLPAGISYTVGEVCFLHDLADNVNEVARLMSKLFGEDRTDMDAVMKFMKESDKKKGKWWKEKKGLQRGQKINAHMQLKGILFQQELAAVDSKDPATRLKVEQLTWADDSNAFIVKTNALGGKLAGRKWATPEDMKKLSVELQGEVSSWKTEKAALDQRGEDHLKRERQLKDVEKDLDSRAYYWHFQQGKTLDEVVALHLKKWEHKIKNGVGRNGKIILNRKTRKDMPRQLSKETDDETCAPVWGDYAKKYRAWVNEKSKMQQDKADDVTLRLIDLVTKKTDALGKLSGPGRATDKSTEVDVLGQPSGVSSAVLVPSKYYRLKKMGVPMEKILGDMQTAKVSEEAIRNFKKTDGMPPPPPPAGMPPPPPPPPMAVLIDIADEASRSRFIKHLAVRVSKAGRKGKAGKASKDNTARL